MLFSFCHIDFHSLINKHFVRLLRVNKGILHNGSIFLCMKRSVMLTLIVVENDQFCFQIL